MPSPRKPGRVRGAPVLAVGDTVACIDGSLLPRVGPFTALRVNSLNPNGSLELQSLEDPSDRFHEVSAKSLTHVVDYRG